MFHHLFISFSSLSLLLPRLPPPSFSLPGRAPPLNLSHFLPPSLSFPLDFCPVSSHPFSRYLSPPATIPLTVSLFPLTLSPVSPHPFPRFPSPSPLFPFILSPVSLSLSPASPHPLPRLFPSSPVSLHPLRRFLSHFSPFPLTLSPFAAPSRVKQGLNRLRRKTSNGP